MRARGTISTASLGVPHLGGLARRAIVTLRPRNARRFRTYHSATHPPNPNAQPALSETNEKQKPPHRRQPTVGPLCLRSFF